MINFMPRLIYLQGKNSFITNWTGGWVGLSSCPEVNKEINVTLPGIKPKIIQPIG
jgi:hypothetical protein